MSVPPRSFDTQQDISIDDLDLMLRNLTIDTLSFIFYSIYPAILIFFIESENVTFRRLTKYCDRQLYSVPITAYLLAFIPISAVLTIIAYYSQQAQEELLIIIKIFSIISLMLIAIYMGSSKSLFRWKTKYQNFKQSEHLLGYYHNYEKNFSQILIGNWAELPYEITQKAVFLIALTGEPVRVFISAVLAYLALVLIAYIYGKKAAKSSVQRVLQIISAIGIFIWIFAPLVYLYIV